MPERRRVNYTEIIQARYRNSRWKDPCSDSSFTPPSPQLRRRRRPEAVTEIDRQMLEALQALP